MKVLLIVVIVLVVLAAAAFAYRAAQRRRIERERGPLSVDTADAFDRWRKYDAGRQAHARASG